MADSNESVNQNSFNFSITDTMERGMGSAELIDDILGTGTSTANLDDIKKIDDEDEDKTAKKVDQKTQKVDKSKTEDKSKEKTEDKPLLDQLSEDEEGNELENEGKPKEDVSLEDKDKKTSEDNRFTALSKDLFQLGVFNKEEDEGEVNIATPEEFLERFNLEKEKEANRIVSNFIGQFGKDYQDAFDAIYQKGVNPREYFTTYNEIENLAELDLKQESNQEAVIRQGLVDQGFEDEEVKAELERLKNYGDLEPVAQRHHKVLLKKQTAKLAEVEQASERKLQLENASRQQYINNVQTVLQEKLKNKEFDGIPINPKLANEIQDFLLVDKYKTPSGEKLTDFDHRILELKRPENHAMKVKVALLLKVLEKDPTLSTIQKAGISKTANTLFSETVKQKGTTEKKQTNNTNTPFKFL